MKKDEIKIGNVVQAKFRKYGVHTVAGVVREITTDGHDLKGTWVSLSVIGGELKDPTVKRLADYNLGVLVPIEDVQKVLQEKL